MALNEISIRNAKPGDRDYKLGDSGGLYLLVKKGGAKLWRQKYRFQGAEKLLSHGAYPTVSLKVARDRRDAAKAQLEAGRDPSAVKRASRTAPDDTFKSWAVAWFETVRSGWAPGHAERVWSRIEDDLIPAFGDKQIADISRQDVLEVLRSVEARGAITIAKRLKGYATRIFDHASDEGAGDKHNPSAEIGRRSLKPNPKTRHMTKLDIGKFPQFFTDLEGFGSERTRLAIELVILTWARTQEVRFAAVDEFDLDGQVPMWRISAVRMKMKREHLIPLSPQAVAVARRLIELSGDAGLLFGGRGGEEVMSNTTMLQALYTMGYKGKATIHGLRGVASTWANEQLNPDGSRRYDKDWVELQLAHDEEDEVRGAYNAAQYLAPRRQMMLDWGAVVESLKKQGMTDDFDLLL